MRPLPIYYSLCGWVHVLDHLPVIIIYLCQSFIMFIHQYCQREVSYWMWLLLVNTFVNSDPAIPVISMILPSLNVVRTKLNPPQTKRTLNSHGKNLKASGVLYKCDTYHSIPTVGSSTSTSADDFVDAFLVDGCIAF